MSEAVLVAAYWSARPASVEECAHRLAALLTELSGVSRPLSSWFQKARSREESLNRPVELSAASLGVLLARGQNRTDTTGQPIPSLGYRLSLWNREDVELSAGVGRTSPQVTNSVILRFGAGSSCVALPDAEHAKTIVLALVNAWEADWGLALPRSLEDVPPPQIGRPRAGWVTWLRGPGAGRWWTTGDTPESATPERAALIQEELESAAQR